MLLSSTVLDRVLDAASGADFAEVFCEESRQTVIRGRSGRMDASSSGREAGVGIRVLSGLHYRYAYTNDLREETLVRLARELSDGSPGRRQAPLGALTAYGDLQPPDGSDYNQKLEIVRRAVSAGMEAGSEIAQVAVRYLDSDRQIFVANTDGLLAGDRQRKTRIQITAYAQSGGEIQSGFAGPGAMAGLEFYDRVDVEGHARAAARQAITAVHSRRCPGGMMSVVVDCGFGGLMFHEACGHSLEANSVAKGASEFAGKLGRPVASPLVTLIDDGTLPGEWGSMSIDDEGNPAQRNVLIENGVLKGYLVDRLESRRMGLPATGSGRRQSYRYPPEARMTNTFIAPGASTRETLSPQRSAACLWATSTAALSTPPPGNLTSARRTAGSSKTAVWLSLSMGPPSLAAAGRSSSRWTWWGIIWYWGRATATTTAARCLSAPGSPPSV